MPDTDATRRDVGRHVQSPLPQDVDTLPGNTYAYQESLYYGVGTRRLDAVTTTQQTGSGDDQLHELRHGAYSYDDAGNVLGISDTPDPALGSQPADQQCFRYDWARRLTGAWTPGSGDCTIDPSVAGLGGVEPY